MKFGNKTEISLDCKRNRKRISIGDTVSKEFDQTGCLVMVDSIRALLKDVEPGFYTQTCCEQSYLRELEFDPGIISVSLDGKTYATGFACGTEGGEVDTSKATAAYSQIHALADNPIKSLLKR